MDTLRILDLHRRGIAEPSEYGDWAEELLSGGHDGEAIVKLVGLKFAGTQDLDWHEPGRLFKAACREAGISNDIDAEIETCFERTIVDAYRQGRISAATLVFDCSALQRRLDLTRVYLRILEDDPDGTNHSGYHSDDLAGADLESRLVHELESHGIVREPGV